MKPDEPAGDSEAADALQANADIKLTKLAKILKKGGRKRRGAKDKDKDKDRDKDKENDKEKEKDKDKDKDKDRDRESESGSAGGRSSSSLPTLPPAASHLENETKPVSPASASSNIYDVVVDGGLKPLVIDPLIGFGKKALDKANAMVDFDWEERQKSAATPPNLIKRSSSPSPNFSPPYNNNNVDSGYSSIDSGNSKKGKKSKKEKRKGRSKKRSKSKSKKDKQRSYVKGNIIGKKHELYTTSIAMMVGLRHAIGGLATVDSKDGNVEASLSDIRRDVVLGKEDFASSKELAFPPRGSNSTPPHNLSHTF